MSFSLHTEALCWLRFGKRLPVVCTEAGNWNADVIGLNSAMCIEVEVKKSIADLRAEFKNKPHKHYVYANAGQLDRRTSSGYVPNYFYFFIPEELADKARPIVEEKAPKAGIAVRKHPARSPFGAGKRNIYILKRPQKLHDRAPSAVFLRSAVMRMATQVCTFRLAADRMKELGLTEKLIADLSEALVGIEGTIDFEDDLPDLERRGAELAWAVDRLDWKPLAHEERIRWIFAAQQLLTLRRGKKDIKHEEIS